MSQLATVGSPKVEQTPEQIARVRILTSPLHLLRSPMVIKGDYSHLEELLEASIEIIKNNATSKTGDPRGPS